MIAITPIIVVVLTIVASQTHRYLKPSFQKQEESFASLSRNLTWKELLTYGMYIRFSVRSQHLKSKNIRRLYLLD